MRFLRVAAVLLLIGLGAACSGTGDAPTIKSYVATEIIDSTISGETEQSSREFWFLAPSSWRLTCSPDPASCDVRLIGDQAWQKIEGKWLSGNYDKLEFPSKEFHAFVLADFNDIDFESTGPGPLTAGEPTDTLTMSAADYAEFAASLFDQEAAATAARERFRDTTIDSYQIVGSETGRLYEFGYTIEGPDIHITASTRVEYDVDVVIEPPE